MKSRFGRWLFLAIAIPVTAAVLGAVADKLEERNGPDSKVVKGLRFGRSVLRPGS